MAGTPGFKRSRQQLFRERLSGPLFIPLGKRDPPARTVPKHFNAVYATSDDRSVRRITGFIRAEHMRDVAEALRRAMDLAFVEPLFCKEALRSVRILLVIRHERRRFAIFSDRHLDEAQSWDIERIVPGPVTLSALRTGDDVVPGANHAIDRTDILGPGWNRADILVVSESAMTFYCAYAQIAYLRIRAGSLLLCG